MGGLRPPIKNPYINTPNLHTRARLRQLLGL